MEWLVLVGAEAVGFAFKKVLADLAVGALEDYVKGFFTDSIKDLVGLAQKDKKSLKVACGKALKEFLALVQQELEDADLNESQLKRYEKPLKKFIWDESVKAALEKPFQMALSDSTEKNASFTPEIFAQRWGELRLEPLPSSLDWGRVAKRYQKKVEHMVRASEELRPILDSRNLEKMRQIMEQSAPIAPDWDLRHYQAGLLDAYDKLDLEGLDSSRSYDPLRLWDMFVPQTVRERGNGAMSGSVLELLNGRENYRYAVILGSPGSGKSTLARYKALQWARQEDAQYLTSQELPLLIELRNYIENRPKEKNLDFLEYLQNGTGVKGGNLDRRELHSSLSASPSLVIFDGLDEVLDDGDRENVAIDIVNFSNRYPQARVLITSRLSGYEQQSQKLRAAEFREFDLQDLDSEQIKDFIRRWHDLAFENKADGWEKRDRLQRSIDNSPAFRELAGNPLLLTMMAILNSNQELPDDRITLYQESSKVLLQLWDAKKHLPADSKVSDNLEYQDKQEILRQVAYRMQLDARKVGNNLAIERSALQGTMTEAMKNLGIHDSRSVALRLRQQLETRSFILCFLGGDNYGFVHRSFQEFFCAWYLVERYERKQNLTLAELKRDIFGRHWQDTAWHEVLSLVACWIDQRFSREILEDLLAVDGKDYGFANLFLAVKCLQDMRRIGQLQSAIAPLEQQLNSVAGGQAPVTPTVRDRAVESLAFLAQLRTP
ncbi:MAG: NACHT domain-containing protein [Oscillatoria sp. SIO1A7]|nr:NACHT domain-containing protein [Oscillatoria sp. SIO1A7]